jgi:hypothetical protein
VRLFLAFWFFFNATGLFVPLAEATVWWASVAGGAANCAAASGASDPGQYRTLAQVVSCAAPGDTIKLKNGTYPKITLTAGSNVVHGTSGNPITLTAENPGLAFIQGDGLAGQALKFANLNWWIAEHLRIENQDNPAYTGSEAQVVYLFNSNDNIIRKNIIRKPNTWGNNGALNVQGDRNIIEENDVLRFHRNGIELFGSGTTNNKVRLNYVGQTVAYNGVRNGPNDLLVAYDAPNNDWENNIAESIGDAGTDSIGYVAWASVNRYFGNICSGIRSNCMVLVSAASITTGASGYVVRHQAGFGMVNFGIFLRSPINADVQNVTFHTSTTPDRGFVANNDDAEATTSLALRNGLFIDTSGVFASPISSVTISHSHEWDTTPPDLSAWADGTSGKTDSPPAKPGDVDPALGECRINIPVGSPFKAVGFGGADIGADATKLYVNGVRTAADVFDFTLTGADRGKHRYGPPVIAGVNDSSTGEVRSDFHQRAGFGLGSCVSPLSSPVLKLSTGLKIGAGATLRIQ